MIVGEIIKVAFQSIRANKLRAALTMLGVIIGVAAVITVVALSTGAQKAVEDRIQALGANLLSIYPGQSFFGGRASDQRVSLTTDDSDALAADATTLSGVVPEMQRNLQVELNGQNANLSVVGTSANYTEVRNYKVPHGRMFTSGDDGARQRYAVLGAQVPTIFNQNPASMIGRTVQIRGQPFEVIGILEPKGSMNAFMNPDEQILIPLKTARFRIFGTDRLRSISVAVKDGTPLEQGMVDIERIMRREHKVRPGGDNDFQIRNQAGDPGDPAADHADLRRAAREHRDRVAHRGRHRYHEHHAGVGDGTHPGDRDPEGHGRHPVQHHVPVPDRGAGALHGWRGARGGARLRDLDAALHQVRLEYAGESHGDRGRVRVLGGGGAGLRAVAGAAGLDAQYHRCLEI